MSRRWPTGSGGGSGDDAPVAELAATDAVEATADKIETVAADGAAVAAVAPGADVLVDTATGEQLAATPIGLVLPAPAPRPRRARPAPPSPAARSPPAPRRPPGSVEAIIVEVFGAARGSRPSAWPAANRASTPARSAGAAATGASSRSTRSTGGRVEAMGYRWEDLLDARVNALVAYSIFQEQGWGPWGCRHAA